MNNSVLVGIWIALVALANCAKADFILNGNFETGAFSPWLSNGNVGVTSSATYRVSGGVGNFPQGNFAANFGGADKAATGVIYQVFNTTENTSYTLNFDYGAFGTLPLGTPANPQTLQIRVLDNITSQSVFSTFVTDDTHSLQLGSLLKNYEFNFTAASSSSRLIFSDSSVNSFSVDGVLDNISITSVNSVPEPSSLLFISLALGSGWILKRKQQFKWARDPVAVRSGHDD